MSKKANNPNNSNKDERAMQRRNSRRGFLTKGGIAAGASALFSAFGLTPFSPVSAASQTEYNLTTLHGTEAEKYTHIVANSQNYQQFRANLQQEHTGIFTLQEDKIDVAAISVDKQKFTTVRVPIAGGVGDSFYMATFTEGSLTILSTIGVLATYTVDQNIHAVAEQNGKTIFNGIITPKGKILHAELYTLNGTKIWDNVELGQIPDCWCGFLGCVLNCLANLGISNYLLALASAICAIVCVVAAGACTSCLVNVLGGFLAQVGYCSGKCSPGGGEK